MILKIFHEMGYNLSPSYLWIAPYNMSYFLVLGCLGLCLSFKLYFTGIQWFLKYFMKRGISWYVLKFFAPIFDVLFDIYVILNKSSFKWHQNFWRSMFHEIPHVWAPFYASPKDKSPCRTNKTSHSMIRVILSIHLWWRNLYSMFHEVNIMKGRTNILRN